MGTGSLLLLLLLACSSGEEPSPDGPLQIVPDQLNMLPTHRVLLTVSNAAGTVTWSSNDPTIATVSTGGLMTAVGIGSTSITATEGTRSGTASINVACDFDRRGPSLRDESELNFNFVDFESTPETLDTSFYAVKGTDRELKIYLKSLLDGARRDEYFSLHFAPSGLGFLPDGTRLESGDSVLITVRIGFDVHSGYDDAKTQFDLLPHGLRPEAGSGIGPLRIRYDRTHIPYTTPTPDPVRDQCQLAAFGLWTETTTPGLWERKQADDLVAEDGLTGVLVGQLEELGPVGVAYYTLEF
jgi:hypothetical protein